MSIKNNNVIQFLKDREILKKKRLRFQNKNFPLIIEKSINKSCDDILKTLNQLHSAIKSAVWDDIEHAVGELMLKLLNYNSSPIATKKTQKQREAFVEAGGVQELLKLFAPPFTTKDARDMTPDKASEKSELWNEVLVIVREVSFHSNTNIDHIFTIDQIVFMFTLLAHQSVFDNCMCLIEEVVACREETFCMLAVPKIYSLIDKFNSRNLSHFCRVLSLLLFEPEDRQIIEGAHILRSTELLQLRRNRMNKSVGSSRVDLQACKLEYSIVSPK